MTTNELIAILNEINAKEGTNAQHTHLHIDAIDSPDANYVVVETWQTGDVDIYITDDARDLIDNQCRDDYFEMIDGMKSVKVYEARYDSVSCEVVL